ncbi:MAG TPA: PIG-L family deacetylase [Candidatus Dojkabacteria bacterium]|nr:PIG-L family deacetylase [Candidatus Dojkabacteria bacterium]
MKDSFEKVFEDVKTVIVITAHPDDLELYAGGTIARCLDLGIRVVSVRMTLGEKGSREDYIAESELKAIRKGEDTQAMSELGVPARDCEYLDLGDGAVEYSIENISKLSYLFRKYQPDLLITHNPEDKIIRFAKDVNWINHRDHQNTGLLAIDAAYPYSRDRNFFSHHFSEDIKPARCTKFLLVDYYDHEDTVNIDVTDFISRRINAHAKHVSQYSLEDAKASADFFTLKEGSDRRWESFRYVVAD